MNALKLYASVIRQPDGTWKRDPIPTTYAEADKRRKFNRVLGGISTQIEPATAAEVKAWEDEHGRPAISIPRMAKCKNGYRVERFYNRQDRCSVTRVLDTEGNQVGDASYDGTKESSTCGKRQLSPSAHGL